MYKVTYRTNVYMDVRDTVSFNTHMGQVVVVKLASYRDAPILRIFVFNIAEEFPEKLPEHFEEARANAVNFTFDCGNCLLGYRNTFSVVIANEGKRGTFFVMTEDDWYFSNVKVFYDLYRSIKYVIQ